MKVTETIDETIERRDPLWQVQLAVLATILLQVFLPDRFVAGPKYLAIGLEVLLLASLVITTSGRRVVRSLARRANTIALTALISFLNIYALVQVASALLAGGRISNGHELILASLNIYLTNVIIFGLWYWELDAGGPGKRPACQDHERDFLFPQLTAPSFASADWLPLFPDYLYLSVTNATAFSPTDTLPLTHRAKMLMAIQALVSLVTLALVAARAVNILS